MPLVTHPKARGRQPNPVQALFGIPFCAGTATDALASAEAAPVTGPRMIVTTNVDHVLLLAENRAFRSAYSSAAAHTLDGMPVFWLARIRGAGRLTRVTGHDLLSALLARHLSPDARLFIVSPSADVLAGTIKRFVARGWAKTQIRSEIPPFGFEADEVYSDRLASDIREHKTTVLLMGVGAPKSEIWVQRRGNLLGSPMVLCIGGALAVFAGCVPRAPISLQRLGLEWFWRFRLAPRRLFRRYFVRSWRFPWLALTNPDLIQF
jgi:N-acetylglucosaminyldiphosphoundecaprenol N-acetyl-beta-D-mannosaminyltransferase